jgi:molecular chaperone DnaK (HSP70)
MDSSKFWMVIAIDLGTTYSGYACAFKGDPDKIFVNKNWTSSQGYQSYKTPTSVLTGPSGGFLAFGYDAQSQYSKHLQNGNMGYNLYQHFKMLLHREKNISIKTMVNSLTGTKKPAMDVFVYMIKSLKHHCFSAVELEQVDKLIDTEIQWVLTVPAIWSESAKDFMREVAFAAGLIKSKNSEQLLLALEPEAAGLLCKEISVKVF